MAKLPRTTVWAMPPPEPTSSLLTKKVLLLALFRLRVEKLPALAALVRISNVPAFMFNAAEVVLAPAAPPASRRT